MLEASAPVLIRWPRCVRAEVGEDINAALPELSPAMARAVVGPTIMAKAKTAGSSFASEANRDELQEILPLKCQRALRYGEQLTAMSRFCEQ